MKIFTGYSHRISCWVAWNNRHQKLNRSYISSVLRDKYRFVNLTERIFPGGGVLDLLSGSCRKYKRLMWGCTNTDDFYIFLGDEWTSIDHHWPTIWVFGVFLVLIHRHIIRQQINLLCPFKLEYQTRKFSGLKHQNRVEWEDHTWKWLGGFI